MEPPSYEDASRHPPVRGSEAVHVSISPPPPYDASLSSPSTPPPSYVEAVTNQPNPFPILTSPQVQTVVTSTSRSSRVVLHSTTQIGVPRPSVSRQTQQQVVVTTQPRPVPIAVRHLRDSPGLIRCPHCRHTVTTKVNYIPGCTAWCLCMLLSLMGLVCGFCLIPFMMHSLKDAHHSCPRCGNTVHIHTR